MAGASCMRMFINYCMVVLMTAFIGSCALNYVDDNGDQRIIGLVSITLDRPADSPLIAGDSVTVENIGIMYSDTPLHTGVSIGYSSEKTVVLKNDVSTTLEND